MAQHFKITITGENFECSIYQPSIDAQARIDGIYIVRTSLPDETLKVPDVVLTYTEKDISTSECKNAVTERLCRQEKKRYF